MFKFTFTKYNLRRGFSMIEALVAITVLTLGVITPLSMLAKSIADANYARNQITAFFLAQEGQEMIINKRDNNRLDNKLDGSREDNENEEQQDADYWLGNLGPCIDPVPNGLKSTDVCYIDAQFPDEITLCPDNGKCPLLKVDEEGFYGYGDDGKESIFTRWIQIEPLEPLATDDNQERAAIVRVKVFWEDKGKTREFNLNSIIYR